MIESKCGAFCGSSPILSSYHESRVFDSARNNSYRTSCNINFNMTDYDDMFSHTCLASCPTSKPRDLYCEIMIELRCFHIFFSVPKS